MKAWRNAPDKFWGRPGLPSYKDKKGRCVLTYDIQALSKIALRQGIIRPSQLGIPEAQISQFVIYCFSNQDFRGVQVG